MTSLKYIQVFSLLSYEWFKVEQFKLVIETASCFLYDIMGHETIETLFYVSSTVFLYWLIISEDKILISLMYKMLLLL